LEGNQALLSANRVVLNTLIIESVAVSKLSYFSRMHCFFVCVNKYSCSQFHNMPTFKLFYLDRQWPRDLPYSFRD